MEARDQPLMPKPSWTPSVMGLVPQNDVSVVLPDWAMMASASSAAFPGTVAQASARTAADTAEIRLGLDVCIIVFLP